MSSRRRKGAANAGFWVGEVGVAVVASEVEGCHQYPTAMLALKTWWKERIPTIAEIELDDHHSGNLFGALAGRTDVGDGVKIIDVMGRRRRGGVGVGRGRETVLVWESHELAF